MVLMECHITVYPMEPTLLSLATLLGDTQLDLHPLQGAMPLPPQDKHTQDKPQDILTLLTQPTLLELQGTLLVVEVQLLPSILSVFKKSFLNSKLTITVRCLFA